MKTKLLLLPLAFITASALASGIKAASINFAAPIVQDHSSLPGDVPFGSIVYDNTASAFMGLDATGTWQSFAAGANRSLSNLVTTSINQSLTPASANSFSLGGSSVPWAHLYAQSATFQGGNVRIEAVVNGSIVRSHGYGTPTRPRALYLDVNAIDPNEPANEMQLVNSDGADINIGSSNAENGNGPGVIKTQNHIRIYPEYAPSAAAATAAGDTGTCSISPGTDVAGTLSITPGGSGITTGAVCNITFGYAYKTAPVCTLTAANTAAGANTTQVYVTSSTTQLTVNFGTAGASATAYAYNFHCLEVGARN